MTRVLMVVLAAGLLAGAAGAVLAQGAPAAPRPGGEGSFRDAPPIPDDIPAPLRERLGRMPPDQREKALERLRHMTPEERRAHFGRMRGEGGPGSGAGPRHGAGRPGLAPRAGGPDAVPGAIAPEGPKPPKPPKHPEAAGAGKPRKAAGAKAARRGASGDGAEALRKFLRRLEPERRRQVAERLRNARPEDRAAFLKRLAVRSRQGAASAARRGRGPESQVGGRRMGRGAGRGGPERFAPWIGRGAGRGGPERFAPWMGRGAGRGGPERFAPWMGRGAGPGAGGPAWFASSPCRGFGGRHGPALRAWQGGCGFGPPAMERAGRRGFGPRFPMHGREDFRAFPRFRR